MEKISSYKDLRVWQKGMNLAVGIYQATTGMPATEQWGLTSQMRRAAVSVPANIAEGYGRQASGEYQHHLSISRGSLLELETHLLLCRKLGFLKEALTTPILGDIEDMSKMLGSLISKIRQVRARSAG